MKADIVTILPWIEVGKEGERTVAEPAINICI